MRTDNISIEETNQMINKFFASGLCVDSVIQNFKFKRTKEAVLENMKKTLKQTILDIQAELLGNKQIQVLKIYDSINSSSKMYNSLLNLSQILPQQLCTDLEVYYKYKAQFLIRSRFKPIETPVEPVTSKKKKLIYHKFIQFFTNNSLFQADLKEEEVDKKDQNPGQFKFQHFTSQYSMQQVKAIFQQYQINKGQMDLVSIKLHQSGFSAEKSSKQNLRKVLLFFLTTGIAKIYKLSNNLDKFAGCCWQKFQKVHKNLMRSFSLEQKRYILRLGIYDDIGNSFVMKMCDRMGLRYKPMGYPKWIKSQNGMGLYEQQKNAVREKIKQQIKQITQGRSIRFSDKRWKKDRYR